MAAALRHLPKGLTGPAEISILLTNDDHQQTLNAQWREKDKPTNVLSFPTNPPFAPIFGLIGDISMARETLEREAIDLDKSFTDHFTHLLVHGFLHCLGYDHETQEEALVMEGLETQILHTLGIADPYEEEIEGPK